MPSYDFDCACGHETTVVRSMGESGGAGPCCGCCGAEMRRVFRAPQVVRETYAVAHELASLRPPSGNPFDGPVVVNTRGEKKAALRAHNARFGSALEY